MRLSSSASVAFALAWPNVAAAAQVGVGDFETGDLSQCGAALVLTRARRRNRRGDA